VSGGERFGGDLPSTVATIASAGGFDAMPPVGTRIGAYLLVAEIGRGGMGRVYLAKDAKLDRQVAIKFITLHGATARLRFLDEARVTARCTHPNIVVIHDIAEHDGLPFMVLEYVRGPSLASLLGGAPIPPEQAVPIMAQVARALVHAHAQHIVHRDLKPGNILLGPDGMVKVVDFGIARYADRPDPDNDPAGTLRYMAPEQLSGGEIDGRCDLFAFGITLFQLLAGRRPHDELAESALAAELSDLERPMPSLAAMRPDLPPELTALVDGCLEKRRDRRIGSSSQVLAALDALSLPRSASSTASATGDVDVRPASVDLTVANTRPVRRRRMIALAAVATTAAALIALALLRRGAFSDHAGRGSATAPARLDDLDAELDRLHAGDSIADEQRLFEEFVEQERDPSVVALAWLHRGDRERRRSDSDAALVSYSSAYARTAEPALQHEALVRLASLYLDRWEWGRLAAAIEVDGRTGVPADAQARTLRDRSLLAVREPAARLGGAGATATVATALLRGTTVGFEPRDIPEPIASVDVDRDGRDELVIAEGTDLVVRSARGFAERSRRPVSDVAWIYCAGADRDGAFALSAGDATIQMHRLDRAAPPVVLDLFAVPTPMACAWSDLDGDGANELYVVGARALFRITRDPDTGWHVARHPLGSVPWAVIGGDLDGDGRGELVVSVGEWRAYDIRVVQFDDAGTLEIRDRVRLGVVTHLVSLGRDSSGRAVIAALKQDMYPSVRNLPADHPLGAPPGIYRLALDHGRLQVLGRTELHRPNVIGQAGRGLFAGDIDGDDRRDLLVRMCDDDDRCDLAVVLADPAGGFAVRVISGVRIMAVIDGDDDAAAEAVALVDGAFTPWILGIGDRPVPPRRFPSVARQPPPASARAAPAVVGAWRRAEDLAAIGLVEVATDALRRIGAFGATRPAQVDALRRAAELLRAHQLSDGDALEALAALEPPGSRVQLGDRLRALDAHVAFVDIEPARRLLAALLADPALPLTDAQRERLVAIRADLDGPRTPLFAGTLHDAWRVRDPLLVQVPPGSRELSIETLMPEPIAAVPLVRGDGVVTLSMTAEVTRTEWNGAVELRLGPRDPTQPGGITVQVVAWGGGYVHRRRFSCTGAPGQDWMREEPLRTADDPVSIRIEVAILPAQRLARCTVTTAAWRDSALFAIDPDPDAAWELAISGGHGASSAPSSAMARISALEVSGFTVGEPSADPIDRAALALVEHRARDALVALRAVHGAAAASWPARRIEIAALDAVGDRDRAIVRLRQARPPDLELAKLLRAREGQLAPAVRAALGRRLPPVLEIAWENTLAHDMPTARVLSATLRELDPLPPPAPATRDAVLALLTFRGQALRLAGRADEGRRALSTALALDGPTLEPDRRESSEAAACMLAADAAARGDLEAADRFAARALAVSPYPELAADRLLLDPVTRPLASRPAGARIGELGRELALGW